MAAIATTQPAGIPADVTCRAVEEVAQENEILAGQNSGLRHGLGMLHALEARATIRQGWDGLHAGELTVDNVYLILRGWSDKWIYEKDECVDRETLEAWCLQIENTLEQVAAVRSDEAQPDATTERHRGGVVGALVDHDRQRRRLR